MQSQNGWCWLCSNNPNFMHPVPGSPLLPVVTFSAPRRDRMRAKTLVFFAQNLTLDARRGRQRRIPTCSRMKQ